MKSQDGMTLLEVVVGLTAMSALVAAAYGAMTVVLNQTRTNTVLSEVLKDTAVRRRLTEWLRHATLAGVDNDFLLIDGSERDGSADLLRFATAAGPDGAIRQVTLEVRRDPGDAVGYLLATVSPVARVAESEQYTLADSVLSFDAHVRSPLVADEAWLDSWVSSSLLPTAIELSIIRRSWRPTVLQIPVIVQAGGAYQ